MTGTKNDLEYHILESQILVVDDAAINRELIISYLKNAGFMNISSAVDGVDALQKAKETNPSLIILDLVMPNMDGVEVIKHLRADAAHISTPIIVQTAISQPEQRSQAWDSGANDVLTKPINKLELLSRVNVQLRTRHLISQLEGFHRRAEDDINQALELQQSLLPTQHTLRALENRHNLRIESYHIPSRFLSGDIWGLMDIGPKQLGVWICDFSGKGIRASLHTFRLHTLIQEYYHCADDPSELVDALNSRLVDLMPSGQFTTFLQGVVDVERDKFIYAAANSTHPIIYNPEQRTYNLGDGTGVPMGVVSQQSYPLKEIDFPPGSSLILYSDLFWEDDRNILSLNEEDLPQLVRDLDGDMMSNAIRKMVAEYDGQQLADDLTFIQISR